jgi:hypothetical protein
MQYLWKKSWEELPVQRRERETVIKESHMPFGHQDAEKRKGGHSQVRYL